MGLRLAQGFRCLLSSLGKEAPACPAERSVSVSTLGLYARRVCTGSLVLVMVLLDPNFTVPSQFLVTHRVVRQDGCVFSTRVVECMAAGPGQVAADPDCYDSVGERHAGPLGEVRPWCTCPSPPGILPAALTPMASWQSTASPASW